MNHVQGMISSRKEGGLCRFWEKNKKIISLVSNEESG